MGSGSLASCRLGGLVLASRSCLAWSPGLSVFKQMCYQDGKRFACTIMLMELAWSVWHFRATPASSIDSNSSLQDVNWSCSFLLRPSSDSSTYMAQAPCSGRGACIQKVLFFEQSSLAILNTHHMEYTAVIMQSDEACFPQPRGHPCRPVELRGTGASIAEVRRCLNRVEIHRSKRTTVE